MVNRETAVRYLSIFLEGALQANADRQFDLDVNATTVVVTAVIAAAE